jgi:hypothetical protein
MRKPVAEGGPGVCIEDVERRGATVQTFSGEDVGVLAGNFETLFSQVEDPVLKSCLTPLGEDINGAFACMVSRQVKPEWWPHLMIDFYTLGLKSLEGGQPLVHNFLQHAFFYFAVLGKLQETLPGLTMYDLSERLSGASRALSEPCACVAWRRCAWRIAALRPGAARGAAHDAAASH